MNELKYSCNDDIQAAYAIKYLVIDIRGDKRSLKSLTPEKIDHVYTRNGKQKSKEVFIAMDFTDSYQQDINQLVNIQYPKHHVVLLTPASIEDMFVRHQSEYDVD